MTPIELRTRPIVNFKDGRVRTYPSAEERLAAKVERALPEQCWEFQGTRNSKGYGQIQGVGRLEQAHRVAYVLRYGSIPTGMSVLHSCDNPPCCNPLHLYVGSAADNTADMMRRDRNVAPRSLANGRAKLSDVDVAGIRAAFAAGESCKGIAHRLGLHSSYVSRLVRGLRRPQMSGTTDGGPTRTDLPTSGEPPR